MRVKMPRGPNKPKGGAHFAGSDGDRWHLEIAIHGTQMATDGDSWLQLAVAAGERAGDKRSGQADFVLRW